LFYRKELLFLTAKEPGRVALPIVAIIKIVCVFFADIKGSCPGLFGSGTVKSVLSWRIENKE